MSFLWAGNSSRTWIIAVESKRAGTSMKYSFGLRLRRQQLPIIEWMTAPRQLA